MSKLLIFSLSAFIGLAAFNPATARTMDKQRTACERDEMVVLKEQLEAEQVQTAEGTVQSPDCDAAPNYKGCQ